MDEIADKTGRSRPTVYRALENARGWCLDDQPRIVLPPGPERDRLEQNVADFSKAEKVRDKFGSDARPAEVIVAPAPPAGPDEPFAVAVCRAMRQAETYQKAIRASREPDWEALRPDLVDEVLADEEVREAGGTSRTAVEKLVKHHASRSPWTDREIEISRRVGRAGAARFCRALEEGHVRSVGVSWGYHVYRLVRSAAIPFPPYTAPKAGRSPLAEAARNVLLFPLIGSLGLDPLMDARGQGVTSGAHANCTRLAEKLGAEAPVVLTQPAYIPKAFHEAGQLRQIWRYIQEDLSIRLVFGHGLADRRVSADGQPMPDPAEAFLRTGNLGEASDGYVDDADCLITGVGACDAGSRAPRLGLLSPEELERSAAAGAIGDCSGSVFWDPLAPPSDENQDFIRTINSRVVGPRLGDFVRATARAREAEPGTLLGTMVLASGEGKAEAVRRLCHWRAVQILVVGSDLADRLAE